ncbi:MAG TPA: CDP-alcohol phosphatidyltransferase family protein [Euzebya sp.]|nr:CDP-alcohol phosphatidyltransferase family protein [Euzebya sp.]
MVRMFDAGLREGEPVVVHNRVWTVANAITFLRLAGLPLFVWLMVGPEAYGMAFLTLAIVGTTDWVDGYVARRFDQVTRLGQVMDPLIDRALLATAGLTMAALGILPWWIIALIVGRDALVLGAGLVLFDGNPQIPVTRTGKFATACLLVGVPGFLLGHMSWGGATFWGAVGWFFTVLGLLTYYAAAVMYARIAYRQLAAVQAAAAQTDLPTGAPE